MKEKKEKLRVGAYIDDKDITLDEYFAEWIKRKARKVKGGTIYTYRTCYYKNISPRIGRRKVVDIERREILKLQDDLQGVISSASCNYMILLVRIVLNDAILDGIIKENPADHIDQIAIEKAASETYHRALSVEEQNAFMQEAKSEYYYEMFAFLISTGVRFGEAAVLTWKDIDFEKRIISINKTIAIDETGRRVEGKPKTKTSAREIPLSDQVRDILQKQKRKSKIVSIQMRDYVFPSINDTVITNSIFNNAIRRVLRRLDKKGIHVAYFTAHAFRDTYATRFIEQGGNPQTLKAILGHASLAMTMDLYAQVLPNTKFEEANRITIAI